MMKFHFVTVVWGASYTDLFLNVALPNQLSSGNLGIFSCRDGSAYKIYTTPKDAEKIRKSPVFAKLSEIISVEIILMDDVNIDAKYSCLAECHRRAIRAADSDCAILVILPPDSIWSDGTFANLLKIASTGKRIVMVAGIRLVKETFVPVFETRYYSKDDLTAAISSRELVKLALEHLHPITRSLFWNSSEFNNRWPSHLYWDVGQEGLLARCFHLHPLMINSYVRGESPSSTVDDDYITLACPNSNDLYVVGDSDEIAGCELSSLSQTGGKLPPNNSSVIQVASWAKYHTSLYHRSFLRHRIRFHSNDVSENWQQVERCSDKVVNDIYRLLKIPLIPKIPMFFHRQKTSVKRMRYYCIMYLARLRSVIKRRHRFPS